MPASAVDREPLRARLAAGLAALSIPLADATVQRLLDYLDLLVRWNRAYNLTAVRDPAEMVTRHLLDSLAVLPYLGGGRLADVGSGPGLPGIPLAIAAADRGIALADVLLIDANGKKARFLREAVRTLRLERVRVAEQRVEAVDEAFDVVTARAFATLSDMLAVGGHLLAPGGRWLALKGRFPQDEQAGLPAGFRVAAIHALPVPGLDADRHLVVLERSPTA